METCCSIEQDSAELVWQDCYIQRKQACYLRRISYFTSSYKDVTLVFVNYIFSSPYVRSYCKKLRLLGYSNVTLMLKRYLSF